MSRLLSLLNQIKGQSNRDILTNTQLEALKEIEWHWRYPEKVNLWGPVGSGKTMVGWIVCYRFNGKYYPSEEAFFDLSKDISTNIILDNVSHSQKKLRRLFAEMQINDVRNSLIITREPNNLGIPCVYLPQPCDEDISMVYNNLSKLGYYNVSSVSDRNLWKIINSVL